MLFATIITMLILFGIMLFMYGIASDDGFVLFALLGMLLIFMSMVVGQSVPVKHEYKYKKKPTVQIECNGSKCDTTYIYKFN